MKESNEQERRRQEEQSKGSEGTWCINEQLMEETNEQERRRQEEQSWSGEDRWIGSSWAERSSAHSSAFSTRHPFTSTMSKHGVKKAVASEAAEMKANAKAGAETTMPKEKEREEDSGK